MVNKIKKILFRVLWFTGIPQLIRHTFQKDAFTIIGYHKIDRETFRKHIKILKKYYTVTPLKNFIDSCKDAKHYSLIITFDDGHAKNYHILEIVKEERIPITVFLCTDIIDTKRHFWFEENFNKKLINYMKKIEDKKRLLLLKKAGFEENKEYKNRHALSKKEIEEMKEYVDFQSHTKSHPILPRCSYEKAFHEIKDSKEFLEKNYQLKIYALAYPNGDYSWREIEMVKKSGYLCAVTTSPGFNRCNSYPFTLKRIMIPDDCKDKYELLVRVSGVWDIIKKFYTSIATAFT